MGFFQQNNTFHKKVFILRWFLELYIHLCPGFAYKHSIILLLYNLFKDQTKVIVTKGYVIRLVMTQVNDNNNFGKTYSSFGLCNARRSTVMK